MKHTDKDYRLIIFDLDGTITDSQMGIVKSLEYSFEQMGRHDMKGRDLNVFIGRSLDDIYMETFNTQQSDIISRAIMHYRERFEEIGMFENKLYPGVQSLLKAIHKSGAYIALASIKPALYSNEILRHFGIMKYFSYTVGSSIDGRHADKGELIDIVMRRFSMHDPGQCIMIGDREGDIIGAHANGIESIAVTYGYGIRDELSAAGPGYMAENTEHILRILGLDA